MAFNMDTAIRIAGKVQGLNDFKALAERLLDVEKASANSKTGFQQLNAESGRLANESVRAAGGARAQAAALQDLGVKARRNASEMRRGAAEVRAFGGVLQKLRGQSAGVVDGVGTSAVKAANNIRELTSALAPTDRQLAKVRSEVLALGASTKTTERSIAQQIDTLKNLRSQAEVNGRLYRQLTSDIDRLKGATQGLDAANNKAVGGFQRVANASKAGSAAIEGQIKMLGRLQGRLQQGGEGYRAVGREIDALKAKAAGLDLMKGLAMPGAGGIGGVASGVTGAIGQIVALRKELAKTSPGRVVLAGEGAAVAGVAGAAGAGVAAGLGGVGGGLAGIAGQLDLVASKAAALPGVLKPLGGLLSGPAAAAGDAIAGWGASLTAAQAKLAALSAPFEAIGTAITSIGPGTAAAAGVASLAIASVYDVLKRRADEAQRDLEQSFRGISDEVQQTLQQLTRLYDQLPAARLQAQQELRQRNLTRLGEVAPDSLEARRAANAVASAEREIAKIQGQQNKLLDDARAKQNAAAELQKQQREIARQRLETQRKLTEQARKEREELQQASAVAGSIRRNRERVAAAQEDLRRRAAEAFAPSRVLALPAAGQTSAPGTGQTMSGGARVLRNFETAGTRDVVGAPMGTLPEALQRSRVAAEQAKGSLRSLFIEITKSEQASNGSVNSLQRQRAAWQALQNAVNPAAPAYERARQKVQQLDEQLKRLTTTQEKAIKQQRGGMGREAFGSALGALAAGGGFQGAAGALAGGLAFSGGPGGLLAGAAITGIGAAGALATRVGVDAETAQVRLKALTEQFGEYNQAQAAATRIAQTLRISQTEATDSFSKLYAALRPTGVTLKEVEDAFIGFTAAARASGATATESSAALLQLKQALGSGVLQGDELRAVREQAPAAAQAIAKEMGVTIGELKKLGSEGKITTDVVLRALARLKNENLGKLNAQFDTSAQALQDLRIAAEQFGATIARVFGPSAVAAVKGLGAAIREVNAVLGALTGDRGAEARIQDTLRARQQAERDTNARPFGALDFGGRQQFFQQRSDQLFQQFQRERADAAARTANASPVTAAQRAEQDAAARERAAARTRADKAAGEATAKQEKQAVDEQTKIRLDAEKRIADFREQSLERATQFERDLADQRLELERSIAEARRRIAGEQEDQLLMVERQRLRGLGLSADAIDAQMQLNEATRRFTEERVQIEQRTTDQRVQIERGIEEYRVEVARGIRDILIDASERMAENMEGGAKRAAGAIGGVIARTGSTGQSTGPHLDARWADGRPISAAQADRYLMVNGRAPSSFGVTSGYGPRQLFGRSFHRGIDFGTPSGSKITLRNGAQLLRNLGNTGAGGYAIEIMTAEGPMRLLHLQAGSAASSGAAASPRSVAGIQVPAGETPGLDRVRAAGAQLTGVVNQAGSVAVAGTFESQLSSRQGAFGEFTQDLDGSTRSVREQRQDFERMVQLQREGLSPEIAKQRIELERTREVERGRLQILEQQLIKDLATNGLTEDTRAKYQALLEGVRARLTAQDGIVTGLTAEAVALEGLQEVYDRNRQLAEGIASTIGDGIGGAIDVLISGTDDWGDSLREIGANVLKDIARQVAQIMVVQPIVKGITSAFGFANGGIMTGDGPVPLRTYSRGGIANSPQLALFGEGRKPEAYVPLPDGRRIPVAMEGGSAVAAQPITVNIAVDAKGTKAEGDQGTAAALGRDLAAVVDQRLMYHKRPGGMLAG